VESAHPSGARRARSQLGRSAAEPRPLPNKRKPRAHTPNPHQCSSREPSTSPPATRPAPKFALFTQVAMAEPSRSAVPDRRISRGSAYPLRTGLARRLFFHLTRSDLRSERRSGEGPGPRCGSAPPSRLVKGERGSLRGTLALRLDARPPESAHPSGARRARSQLGRTAAGPRPLPSKLKPCARTHSEPARMGLTRADDLASSHTSRHEVRSLPASRDGGAEPQRGPGPSPERRSDRSGPNA